MNDGCNRFQSFIWQIPNTAEHDAAEHDAAEHDAAEKGAAEKAARTRRPQRVPSGSVDG